jgi:hypothetical protein
MGKLVKVAAPIVGGLVGGPAGAAIGSAIGGAVAGREAGKAAQAAADTSANAQLAAARIAAEEARFRPVGITTRFGQSQFGFDDAGRLTSAGYTVSPELQALQQRLLGVAPGSLETALGAEAELGAIRGAVPGLFGLAGQLLPTDVSRQASPEELAYAQQLGMLGQQVTPTSYDPTAAAQSYFAEQQAMLDPVRQREEQRLASSVFGRGRAGLSVGDMGQPELFTLAQARGQQDLALAAQARERARQELRQDIGLGTQLGAAGITARQQAENLARARFAEDLQAGTGLFGTGASLLGLIPQYQTQAMAPFQTQLGLAQTIENLGQQPLDIGAQLGGRTATAGAQAGEALLRGGLGAAQSQLTGNLLSSTARYGTLQDLLGNQQIQRGIGGLFNRPTVASLGGTTGSEGFSYYGR